MLAGQRCPAKARDHAHRVGDPDGVGERVCVGVPHAFERFLGADDAAVGDEQRVQD